MGSYAGCLPETLRSRPATRLGAIEFVVNFTDKDHAVLCANTLIGRPFLDTQPDFGAVTVKVRTQAEVVHAKAMIERSKDRYTAPTSSTRSLLPAASAVLAPVAVQPEPRPHEARAIETLERLFESAELLPSTMYRTFAQAMVEHGVSDEEDLKTLVEENEDRELFLKDCIKMKSLQAKKVLKYLYRER
jgi:hypothetical protein